MRMQNAFFIPVDSVDCSTTARACRNHYLRSRHRKYCCVSNIASALSFGCYVLGLILAVGKSSFQKALFSTVRKVNQSRPMCAQLHEARPTHNYACTHEHSRVWCCFSSDPSVTHLLVPGSLVFFRLSFLSPSPVLRSLGVTRTMRQRPHVCGIILGACRGGRDHPPVCPAQRRFPQPGGRDRQGGAPPAFEVCIVGTNVSCSLLVCMFWRSRFAVLCSLLELVLSLYRPPMRVHCWLLNV